MNNLCIEGDCLEIMATLPEKSIDMVLCDLPYGTTACKWDIIIPFEPLWVSYKRLIKDNGVIVLFGNEPFSSFLRLSNIEMYKYDWVWNKVKPTGFQIVKAKPMQKHEIISVFYSKTGKYHPQREKKKKARHTGHRTHHKENSIPLSDKYLNGSLVEYSYPTTILEFSNADQTNRLHPTQKPVALFEYLICTYTDEGDIVLDNCAGSGTTGVACMNTGRAFILIEKDRKYCEIIDQRLKQHQRRGMLFL